ncbi:MAG TPA: aldo/keto reductase [Candidatus Binatus sp.]|nr:aldo/keto reductase [Candidatus Binatus sp.]
MQTPTAISDISSRARLNSGVEMPWLGLGVYGIPKGHATQKAVKTALEVGYRLVDTARLYGNEEDVGIAVRQSGIARDEIFVTTKLWNTDHGYDSTLRAFQESLRRLNLDYIDLYLIHWPEPGLRSETWKAMIRILKQGKCRSIGVSNYTTRHLDELFSESDVIPDVNQVEFHPFLYQEKLLEYCRKNRIQLEAYSPLAKGHRLDDPKIRELAQKHRKTSAQILIRWSLQHQVVAIPKSSKRERIIENSQVFDFQLSTEEMRKLDSLTQALRTSWDPTGVP